MQADCRLVLLCPLNMNTAEFKPDTSNEKQDRFLQSWWN